MPEESSLRWHRRFDLEGNAILEWVLREHNSLSIERPSLGWLVVAESESEVSVFVVMAGVWLKAGPSSISDVSVGSLEEEGPLGRVTRHELSHNSSMAIN